MILILGSVGGTPPTLTRTHLEQLSTTSYGSFFRVCNICETLMRTTLGEPNL